MEETPSDPPVGIKNEAPFIECLLNMMILILFSFEQDF